MAFIEIYNPSSTVVSSKEEIGVWFRLQYTASDDNAHPLTSSSTVVLSAVLYVKTNACLVGDSSNQTYPLANGDTLSVEKVDLSEIYVKNSTSGNNVVIEVVGVKRA